MQQTKPIWFYQIFRTNDGWRWQVMRDDEPVGSGIAADMTEARIRVMLRGGRETQQDAQKKGQLQKSKGASSDEGRPVPSV